MKNTTSRRKAEFYTVAEKFVEATLDPRGGTITGFSAKEVAAFQGLTVAAVYTNLKRYGLTSVKLGQGVPLNSGGINKRNCRRIIPMETFYNLQRRTGTHRNLNKHVSKCVHVKETLSFYIDMLNNDNSRG